MRITAVAIILALLTTPVLAATDDAESCEERFQEAEKTFEEKMENADGEEERRSIRESFEQRMESIEEDCEPDQATETSSQSQPAPDRTEQRQPPEMTAEDVVEWSESYPRGGIRPETVNLTDEQFQTVKNNMLDGLSEPKKHLPDQINGACEEQAVSVATEAKDRVKSAETIKDLMEVHRETGEEIEAVLQSKECQEQYAEGHADEAISSQRQVARNTSSEIRSVPDIGEGSRMSAKQIEDMLQRIQSLQDRVQDQQKRIQEQQQTIDQLQSRIEDGKPEQREDEATIEQDIAERNAQRRPDQRSSEPSIENKQGPAQPERNADSDQEASTDEARVRQTPEKEDTDDTRKRQRDRTAEANSDDVSDDENDESDRSSQDRDQGIIDTIRSIFT